MPKVRRELGSNEPAGPRIYDPNLNPQFVKGIDGLLSIHRPLVLAHIRSIRKRHPDATPAQILRVLEIRYLSAVTTGGAAVGAGAVVPGVGVGISLALTGVETAGFLEASALFAQSVTEVHGIAVDDPDRARTLVMSMMLGTAGADLVRQLAGQVTGAGETRTAYWGTLVTRNLPQFAVGPIADRLKTTFIKHLAARTGAGAIGRLVPFGVGAVIGGTGNHILGRKVVNSARLAFGPPPIVFPAGLEPRQKTIKEKAPKDQTARDGAEHPGGFRGPRAIASGAGTQLKRLVPRKRDRSKDPGPLHPKPADPAQGSDTGHASETERDGQPEDQWPSITI